MHDRVTRDGTPGCDPRGRAGESRARATARGSGETGIRSCPTRRGARGTGSSVRRAAWVGLGVLALAGIAGAGPEDDGSHGSAARRGSRTEVDSGGVSPARSAIGAEINVYGWGTPDPDSGRKSRDDGDWLEVKGGGGDVWSKGHVFDADYRSGASTVRGGATSSAVVEIRVSVPTDCTGTGTCSDAITLPWDYSVTGDGVHVLHCTGTAVDIKGETHAFTLDPVGLSSAHRVARKADQGESQRGSSKGSIGLPSLLKVEAHDEGTVTSSSSVEYAVTSSSASAKSGVVSVASVTDTKAVVDGVCAWEFSSSVLDTLSAQAVVARADTALGRFDVLHAIETSWSIVCNVDPTRSHGPHDLGPLRRTRLAPQTTPRTPLPTPGAPAAGGMQPVAPTGDGATARIVDPRGLASEEGSAPGLLVLETDRRTGPALTWALEAVPAGRVRLPATLVVRADDPSATAPVVGLEAGAFTMSATLLDAGGLPTASVLVLSGTCSSVVDGEEPRLAIRGDGGRLDPSSGRLVARAGSSDLGLRLERTGFGGLRDTSTTFELDTIDPRGVLRAPPPTATIQAGETEVRVPLELVDVEGDADLIVRCGDFTGRVAVRSVRQSLEAPIPGATVPVGGRAVLPVALRVPESAARVVTVVSLDPAVASVPSDASQVEFAPDAARAWIAFGAQALGTTTLRLSTPGVPDLDVPVTVVASEIAVTRGDVTLSSLGAAAAGVMRLRLPVGATWRGAVADSGAGVGVLDGLGTRTLVLEIAPRPDRDRPIVLPVTLEGAPAEAFDVEIDDRAHADRSIYRVTVP